MLAEVEWTLQLLLHEHIFNSLPYFKNVLQLVAGGVGEQQLVGIATLTYYHTGFFLSHSFSQDSWWFACCSDFL